MTQNWEDMNPDELKKLIEAAIKPIRDDNAGLRAKMVTDNAALQARIEAMKTDNTEPISPGRRRGSWRTRRMGMNMYWLGRVGMATRTTNFSLAMTTLNS